MGLGLGDPDTVHRSDDAPPENYSGLGTNVALYVVSWYILYGILARQSIETDDRAARSKKEEEDRNMTSGSSSSNHMNIRIISKSLKFI